MNSEIKKEWIDALRSGKYAQGKNALRNGDAYCCLGVLCDVLKERVDGSWVLDSGTEMSFDTQASRQLSVLPQSVINLAGKDVYEVQSALIDMNDCGQSFEAIATYIEEKL